MIKLIGILIVIIGATFELNPLLTILAAAFASFTSWEFFAYLPRLSVP